MSKTRKTQPARQGDIMRASAWDRKVRAMRDGSGSGGQRVWTAKNKRAVASKGACRGKVTA